MHILNWNDQKEHCGVLPMIVHPANYNALLEHGMSISTYQ